MASQHRTAEDVTPLGTNPSSASPNSIDVEDVARTPGLAGVSTLIPPTLEQQIVMRVLQLIREKSLEGPDWCLTLPTFTEMERALWEEGCEVAIRMAIMGGRVLDLVRLFNFMRHIALFPQPSRGIMMIEPFYFACQHGKRLMLRLLIRERGWDIVNSMDRSGITFLSRVCQIRSERRAMNMLRSLDRFYPIFSLTDYDGTPPVLHALRLSHWRLAESMFERMYLPSKNFESDDEEFVRHYVRDLVRSPRRVDWACDPKMEEEMSLLVVSSNREGLIRTAYTVGGLVPDRLYGGRNLLHRLCNVVHPFDRLDVIIEFFLRKGLQADAPDKDGMTPKQILLKRMQDYSPLDQYHQPLDGSQSQSKTEFEPQALPGPQWRLGPCQESNPLPCSDLDQLVLTLLEQYTGHPLMEGMLDEYLPDEDGESTLSQGMDSIADEGTTCTSLHACTSRDPRYSDNMKEVYRTLDMCDPPRQGRVYWECLMKDRFLERHDRYGRDVAILDGDEVNSESLPQAALLYACHWYASVTATPQVDGDDGVEAHQVEPHELHDGDDDAHQVDPYELNDGAYEEDAPNEH